MTLVGVLADGDPLPGRQIGPLPVLAQVDAGEGDGVVTFPLGGESPHPSVLLAAVLVLAEGRDSPPGHAAGPCQRSRARLRRRAILHTVAAAVQPR